MNYRMNIDSQGNPFIEVDVTGFALITNPVLNKGMGFTEQERDEFELHGLLPSHVANMDEQRKRSYEAFKSKTSDIEKYIYLRDLQDSNETLFYNLLCQNVEEFLPIVYTPVVGLGCQRFSHVYRRARGLFLSYPNREKIDKILQNKRFDSVEVIVVSDGERILGLGDQGAGGMGIPIGKLSLYSACAGIHPASTLPILLDTGTNNQDLLQDPLYIGWHHERIRGKEYDEFIDLFVNAVKKRFPHVLLQWEDFALPNASPIIERYADQLCTFNDDIQGTASVVVGTLLAAIDVTGIPLADHRIAVVGAGSAGCGISQLIKQLMVEKGISEKEALSKFFLIDRNGLLLEGMKDLLSFQKPFCQPKSTISGWKYENPSNITLKEVIKNAKPTLLIGVSGQPNIFTEEIVRDMASYNKRPIIFPLSNPNSRCEATPANLMKWTEGRVVIGTGSPFPDVEKNGRPFRIDQTNNSYIFPGLGLGVIAVQAKRVTNKMFLVAAQALAEYSPAKKDPNANLLPPLTDIRKVAEHVALAVAKYAVAEKLASPLSVQEIEKRVKSKMWNPVYLPYKKLT